MVKKNINSKDVEDNKVVASLSYLSILFLVPLFLKRDSSFAQFHAKQGLLLFLVEIALMVIGVIPILGWVIAFIGWVYVYGVAIVAILKALNGKKWDIPIISDYTDKLNL